MEAQSVEDDEISYNVYVYNAQPGITIDYATGNSWLDDTGSLNSMLDRWVRSGMYLIPSSKKFHLPDCSGAQSMSETNRKDYTGSRQALIDQGYAPCGICKP